MILNVRSPDFDFDSVRCRVFVDGVEIKHAWYADTDAGFVRTCDVLGDGKPHIPGECGKNGIPAFDELSMRGVYVDGQLLCKVVTGYVVVMPLSGTTEVAGS